MASISDDEIGQNDVHFDSTFFENDVESEKKQIPWNQVCFFISYLQKQSSQLPDRVTIGRLVGCEYEQYRSAFDKGYGKRHPCIETEYGGFLRHDDTLHNISKMALQIGQKEAGVVADIVGFSGRRCDLLGWFDPTREYEIHAEVRMSPKGVPIVPEMIWDDEHEFDWDWCKIRISFPAGRVRVEMCPFHKDHKYGLNDTQYRAYIDEITQLLRKLIGFAPLMLLEVIKFDLQQDHRCESYDEQHNRKLIYSMLGLQEYAIWRDDAPEKNHRKELMVLNSNGAKYIYPAKEILEMTDYETGLGAMIHVGNLADRLMFAYDHAMPYFRDTVANTVKFHKAQAELNREHDEKISQVHDGVNQLREDLVNSNQSLEDKLDQTTSRVQTIADEHMGMISRSMETISRNSDTTTQYFGVVAETLQTVSQTQMEISDILYELEIKHQEWEEIPRRLKLDVISRMDGLEMSMVEIHETIDQHFDVTYGALYQFWKYWQHKNDSAESEKRSRQIGHESMKNDSSSRGPIPDPRSGPLGQIDSDIIAAVQKVVADAPGLNTSAIVNQVTGATKAINDVIRHLRHTGGIRFERYKNSYRYYPSDPIRSATVPQGTQSTGPTSYFEPSSSTSTRDIHGGSG